MTAATTIEARTGTLVESPPSARPGGIASDPFERRDHGPVRFLHRLNPLAIILAVLPAMIALVFVRELSAPIVLLALATVLAGVGAHVPAAQVPMVFLFPSAFVLLAGATFAITTPQAGFAGTPALFSLGEWTVHSGSLVAGFGTSVRLGALASLAVLVGVAASAADLVRAAVQHLRVPYRIGVTAMAAFRFVPRFAHELETIRAAHRVRGVGGGRGPVGAVRRWAGWIVPLLAGALRHAERVAYAMDARAFGAHPTRTERYPVPVRIRDAVFVTLAWIATAAILLWAQRVLGLPIPEGPR